MLVLDYAPYHHGFNLEINAPELDMKLRHTNVLQRYGVEHVCIPCEFEDDQGM